MTKGLWKLLISAIVAGSLVLAACGGAAAPAEEAPAEEAPAEEEAEEEAAEEEAPAEEAEEEMAEEEMIEVGTITFLKLTNELEGQAFEEMVADFQAIEGGKYADFDITYDGKPFSELFTTIETAIATGQDVDLIQADGPDMKHFAFNGILHDLTDEFSAEEYAQWMPQSIEEGSAGGRFYGPPMRQSCSVMWVNPDMAEAAGVDIKIADATAWTYEAALSDLWQPLTVDADGDGNPEVFGVRLGQGTYFGDYEFGQARRTAGAPGSPTYQGIGEDGITFTGYFNTEEAIAAHEFVRGLYQGVDGQPNVATSEPVQDSFLAGTTATYISPDIVVGIRDNQFPDAPLEATGNVYFETPICHTGSWHYGIATTTDQYDITLEFVRYAGTDVAAEKYYAWMQQLPANVAVLNSLPVYQEYPFDFVKEFFVEYGQPRIGTPGYTEYAALFFEYYTSLINTDRDVTELSNEYAELMDEAVSKYAGWNE